MYVILCIILICWLIIGAIAGINAVSEGSFPAYHMPPAKDQPNDHTIVHWTRAIHLKKTLLFSAACGPVFWILLGAGWFIENSKKILKTD